MKLNLNTGLSALPKIGAGTGPAPFPNTYSTEFDGADDYVDIGLVTALNGATTFSISTWVKADTFSGSKVFFAVVTNSSNRIFIEFHGANIAVNVSSGGSRHEHFSVLSVDTWYHIVLVFDGGETGADRVTLYVNGVAETTTVTTWPASMPTFTTSTFLGSYDSGLYPFNGKQDETSIWSIALSSGQVSDLYNSGAPTNLASESGLVFWSRQGDSAVFNADSQWEFPEQTKVLAGNWSSHSFEFDGVNDRVEFGSTIDLGTTSSESIWIKQDTPAVGENIIGIPWTASYHLHLSSDSTVYVRNVGQVWTFDDAATKTAINTTNWIHIAIIRTGVTTCILYVNGVDNDGIQTNVSMSDNTEITCLGSSLNGSYPYRGLIDGYSVWDEALTSGNIDSIYADGVPNDVSDLGISGLQGYWRMGEGADWNNTNWQVPDYSKNALFSQQSFELDGVDQYVDLGTNTYIDSAAAFSVSCWVKITDFSPNLYPTLMQLKTDTTYGWIMAVSNHSSYLGVIIGSGNSSNLDWIRVKTSTAASVFTGNWVHVVATYNGNGKDAIGNFAIYVNGSSASLTTTIDFATNNQVNRLGVAAGTGSLNFLEGNMDSVSIWNTELTAGNVTSIYNSGVPNDISGLGISGLIGWWKMGEGSTFSTNWTIPDASTNSNDGTSANMNEVDKKYISPGNENSGESSGMNEIDNINNAPDNENQGLSVGMVSGSVVEETP